MLQEHRPTPLTSSVCYTTQVKEAVRLAELVTGATSNTIELHWLLPITYPLPTIKDIEDDNDVEEVDPFTETLSQPEQVLLNDVLDGRDYEDEEDINEDKEPTLTAKLQWNPPHISDVFPIYVDVSHTSPRTSLLTRLTSQVIRSLSRVILQNESALRLMVSLCLYLNPEQSKF